MLEAGTRVGGGEDNVRRQKLLIHGEVELEWTRQLTRMGAEDIPAATWAAKMESHLF